MGSNGPAWGRRVELSWARDQWLAKQREADRARCQYWNLRMSERGPAQPSPTIRQAVHGGFPFLRVTCRGCNQTQWVDLRDVKRRPDTPIWTMEGSLACDWCRIRSTFPPKTVIERLTRDRGTLGWPKD
jgi:hypothetical protein